MNKSALLHLGGLEMLSGQKMPRIPRAEVKELEKGMEEGRKNDRPRPNEQMNE